MPAFVDSHVRTGGRGQTLAEYALILGLIAVVAIAAVTLLGGDVSSTLNRIATAV